MARPHPPRPLQIAVLLAILAACEEHRTPPPAPRPPIAYNVSVAGLVLPTRGAALLAQGVEVGRFDEHTSYVETTLPAEVMLSETPGALSVGLDTTCGPIVLPLPARFDTPLAERQERAESTIGGETRVNYYASPPEHPPAMARLWLDNRGGEAAVLSIGTVHVTVEADATRAELIALGTCPDGRSVRLGDAPWGELPPARAGDAPAEYVASVAGEQCYRDRPHVYAGELADPSARSSPATYSGGRILAVRPVSFFLERAPDSIDGAGWGSRAVLAQTELFELQRTRCP